MDKNVYTVLLNNGTTVLVNQPTEKETREIVEKIPNKFSFLYGDVAEQVQWEEDSKTWSLKPGEAKRSLPPSFPATREINMEKLALAQFIGFSHGQQGYSALSLATAMGLKKQEWLNIKEDISLKETDKQDIDKLFK